MKSLKKLSFNAKKINPDDYIYLVQIPNIEELKIPIGMFKTSEFAWIKAHLKGKAKDNFLKAFVQVKPIKSEIKGKYLDTFIVGKRKPFLDSKTDEKRIEKYISKYNNMVDWFERNPEKMPDDYKPK